MELLTGNATVNASRISKQVYLVGSIALSDAARKARFPGAYFTGSYCAAISIGRSSRTVSPYPETATRLWR